VCAGVVPVPVCDSKEMKITPQGESEPTVYEARPDRFACRVPTIVARIGLITIESSEQREQSTTEHEDEHAHVHIHREGLKAKETHTLTHTHTLLHSHTPTLPHTRLYTKRKTQPPTQQQQQQHTPTLPLPHTLPHTHTMKEAALAFDGLFDALTNLLDPLTPLGIVGTLYTVGLVLREEVERVAYHTPVGDRFHRDRLIGERDQPPDTAAIRMKQLRRHARAA
jgi:hypothetical protein